MPFIEHFNRGVAYVSAPNIWSKHAFTTRLGGVSRGYLSSLNLGLNLNDSPANVRENYKQLCKILKMDSEDIVRSQQVHGAEIRIVTSAHRGALFEPALFEADGMITCERNIALIIHVADCVPILLHDPIRGVVGAVHAGWRGTAANIVGAAVQKMRKEFGSVPEETKAAIGPSIGKCCYEVGSDVSDALRRTLGDAADGCLEPREKKFMADLKEANRSLLMDAGVHDISVSDECTRCTVNKYWSHRATGNHRGSQCAIISL